MSLQSFGELQEALSILVKYNRVATLCTQNRKELKEDLYKAFNFCMQVLFKQHKKTAQLL